MDGERVARLREALRDTGWWARALAVGDVVRRTESAGGLLVVGTPQVEPWHLVAHLADEADFGRNPTLRPTLVRWAPPADAPPHLSITLDRLEHARRGETVFVVAPTAAPDPLLERVHDARRVGANIVSLDSGDPALDSLVHERMSVDALWAPELAAVSASMSAPAECFDLAQHLISSASGRADDAGSGWRERLLSRLAFRQSA